jgi:YD repeat-containing protein
VQNDPDMGAWHYTYDAVGNLVTQMDNKDVTISKTYDELNRVTKTDHPTDVDILYTYDGNGKTGTLTSVTDKVGIVNYSYDNRLRKIQEQRSVNGTTKTTGYSYDSLDRVISETKPDGEVVTYTHNNQGDWICFQCDTISYNAWGRPVKPPMD